MNQYRSAENGAISRDAKTCCASLALVKSKTTVLNPGIEAATSLREDEHNQGQMYPAWGEAALRGPLKDS